MPLIFQNTLLSQGKLAVWKIIEDDLFFSLPETECFNTIAHPQARLHKKAGRFLLKYVDNTFPLQDIVAEKNHKPFLKNHNLFFSISHSHQLVAVALLHQKNVGIDIQRISSKALKVGKKFLTEKETLWINQSANAEYMASLFWSMKECFYKYLGKSGVSFQSIEIVLDKTNLDSQTTCINYEKNLYPMYWQDIGKEYVLSWLVSPL